MNPISHYPHLLPAPKNWHWTWIWGILLIILGILAISFAVFTTLLSILFVGALLFVSGLIIFIDACMGWWKKWSVFLIQLGIAILYVAAGIIVMQNPIMASVTLTLLLGALYIGIGIARIVYSYPAYIPQRRWRMGSGVVTLILGLLILANWPAASLWLIGLFIGIDLIFVGWTYLMLGTLSKRVFKGLV